MVYVSAVTGFDHDHRCSLPLIDFLLPQFKPQALIFSCGQITLVSLVFSEMPGPE